MKMTTHCEIKSDNPNIFIMSFPKLTFPAGFGGYNLIGLFREVFMYLTHPLHTVYANEVVNH